MSALKTHRGLSAPDAFFLLNAACLNAARAAAQKQLFPVVAKMN
jgi:hypothetical protein